MRMILRRGVLLLAVMGACLTGGSVFADVSCAEFELWLDNQGGGYYFASLCDGEPNSCTFTDFVGMYVLTAYDSTDLPRVCNTEPGGEKRCEYEVGTGDLRSPRTGNIAQTTAAGGVQQVVYYQCGKRCYCYTVCTAAVPTPAARANPSRIDPSRSPQVTRNIRMKAPWEESYMPRKNQKSPFAENINIGFPTYFSFASLRKPGATLHAKGFVVTTRKFQSSTKTYPGLTLTNGFEVKKGSEKYPFISAENVKLASNTTSCYVVKVGGVDYLVHTTE